MIDLATPEIWLVCGSQHLYGPGPLEEVASHAREIAAALAGSSKLPLKTVFKALADDAGRNRQALSRGELRRQLRRPHPLDAHVFAVENVDARAERAAKAVRASPHPVQSRSAVGHDRHGLHEPEPVGARRPRGGLHPHAHAPSRARSWSATGPIRKFRTASAPGCGPRAPGTIGRARNSAASATTCGRWRSPRATRSRPK